MGKAGQIVAFDHQPAAVPKRVRRALGSCGVEVRLGDEVGLLDGPAPRTLIRSPGVRLDAPLVREARRRGAEVIDELELGWRLARAPLVGITGTNGKTTTSALASSLLEAAGLCAPLAGNADVAPPLSAIRGQPDAIVCEVSSFQLEACPTFVPEVGVFTNLSPDHLARHGDIDRYAAVKRSLFVKGRSVVPLAVVDTIDQPGARLADEVERAGARVVRLGRGGSVPYRLLDARWDLHGGQFALRTPTGTLELRTNLPGVYNARNAALVVALADSLELPRTLTVATLARHPGVEGRFEHIGRIGAGAWGARLILDSAATPAAAGEFLAAVRAGIAPGARLHAVVGLLGVSEPAQRRALGRMVASLCDRVVVTSGSYRSKPPAATMEEILVGARGVEATEVIRVPRRELAIAVAAAGASRRDVVCVIGRGNLVEVIDSSRVDDRGVMRRLVDGAAPSRSGPKRLSPTSSRELSV
ncbi:MAG: Mur ligase family protein [Syntrophothermus sp.]